jgi:hypothetical protein
MSHTETTEAAVETIVVLAMKAGTPGRSWDEFRSMIRRELTTIRKETLEEVERELGIDRFGSWNEHKEYMRERLLNKIK